MTEYKISLAEKMAIEGIQLRFDTAREAFNKVAQDIAQQDRLISDFIAGRLGLPENAIGKTHRINKEDWTVVEIPQPKVEEEEKAPEGQG